MTAVNTPSDATDQVANLLADLVCDVMDRAHALGRRDLRDLLQHRLQACAATAPLQVVVAGEVKRGKTSLVNALLGMPDLLPVDEDVCTATYAVVEHATEPRAEVTFVDGDVTGVPFASLPEWASVIGDDVRAGRVQSLRVGLDAPLLRQDLVLIDTPGVHGRVRGHDQLTRSALRMADVVLFVLDCDTEITGPEIDFLRTIAGQIQHLTVVATKNDFAGAEHVAQRTRQLLRRHLPDLDFELISLSSAVKRRADLQLRAGDRDGARELFEQSGMRPLLTTLRAAVQRRVETRSGNVLHAAVSAADELARDLEARGAAVTADDPQAAIAEARVKVQTVVEAAGQAHQLIRSAFERLREELTDEIRRQLDEVQRTARSLDAQPQIDVEAARTDLRVRLDALSTDTHRQLVEGILGIVEIANEHLRQRHLSGLLDDFSVQLPPDQRAPLIEPPTAAGPTLGEQVITYLPAVYAPAAIGQLLAAGGVAVGAPVLSAIGLPVIAASLLMRRSAEQRRRQRQEITELIRSNVDVVLRHPDGLTGSTRRTVAESRDRLLALVRERTESRVDQLRREYDELTRLASSRSEARRRERRRIARQQADVVELRERLATIERGIRAALEEPA